jgi:hypothetical protein
MQTLALVQLGAAIGAISALLWCRTPEQQNQWLGFSNE